MPKKYFQPSHLPNILLFLLIPLLSWQFGAKNVCYRLDTWVAPEFSKYLDTWVIRDSTDGDIYVDFNTK